MPVCKLRSLADLHGMTRCLSSQTVVTVDRLAGAAVSGTCTHPRQPYMRYVRKVCCFSDFSVLLREFAICTLVVVVVATVLACQHAD